MVDTAAMITGCSEDCQALQKVYNAASVRSELQSKSGVKTEEQLLRTVVMTATVRAENRSLNHE